MMTREQAWELLTQYNTGEFHLKHAVTLEEVMGWFAEELGYGEEKQFWSLVGLLHDLDFEQYPEQHCIKSQEMMRELDIDEGIIRSTASHCFGLHEGCDIEPVHIMEKYLFATDELTGLIGAAARMRPSKSCQDMELKSVMKKYKTPAFAAGCSREVIGKGAEMLGITVDELCQITLDAMKALGL